MEKKSFTCTLPRLANRIVTPVTLFNPVTGKTFEARALWDTGASCSAISTVAAEFLQLKKVGKIVANGIYKSRKVNQYFVQVRLSGDIRMMLLVSAFESDILAGIDCIIGMDVILEGDLAISSGDDKVTFTFRTPPGGVIDFTKSHKVSSTL